MSKTKRVILCFVLCIPLVAAIILGVNNPVTKSDNNNELSSVVITSSDGTLFEYSDEDTLDFYKSILKNSSSVSGPVPGEDSTQFSVNYKGTQGVDEYTFIMSAENPSNCVYKNLNGEAFLIKHDDARSLLLRNEFADAYVEGTVPEILFAYAVDKEFFISADTYNWKYKRVDDEFSQISDFESGANTSVVKLPQNSSFTMSFANTPDDIVLVAKNGGNTIYTGVPESLVTALAYANDTILDITVEAKWYEAKDSKSFGEATYEFKLLYDIPATYALVDKQLKQGEFTIINVTNGNDDEVIKASADFIEKEMTAFTYEGKKYIYIPIKRDAEPRTYPITITSDYGTSTLNFGVVAANFKDTNVTYSANVITLNTANAKAEYENILKDLSSETSNQRLWSGKFTSPVAGGTVSTAFGTEMNVTGVETKVSDGVYIKAANGTAVKAANSGVVLYAGMLDYTGNTVIIDHGLGVFSYYLNLGSVSCNAGDSVVSGTAIGTVGTSGVTPYTDTMFYANSLDGVYVNPVTQYTWGIELK